MVEEWREIDGYPGYFASSEGRILSTVRDVYSKRLKKTVPYKRNKILAQTVQRSGYVAVNIHGKTVKTHRLIAGAFCENPQNLPQVNHKDGDKRNNRADNLEWCDASYNQRHAYLHGLSECSEKRRNEFLKNRMDKSVSVCGLFPDGSVRHYKSMQALADDIGVDRSCVSRSAKSGKPTKGIRVEITIEEVQDDTHEEPCRGGSGMAQKNRDTRQGQKHLGEDA